MERLRFKPMKRHDIALEHKETSIIDGLAWEIRTKWTLRKTIPWWNRAERHICQRVWGNYRVLVYRGLWDEEYRRLFDLIPNLRVQHNIDGLEFLTTEPIEGS